MTCTPEAPAEVETRPGIICFISTAVVAFIPLGIFIEIEVSSIDCHLVSPEFAGAVPGFEDRQQAEVSKGGAVRAVFLEDGARRGLAVEGESQQATVLGALGIVCKLPLTDLPPLADRRRRCLLRFGVRE